MFSKWYFPNYLHLIFCLLGSVKDEPSLLKYIALMYLDTAQKELIYFFMWLAVPIKDILSFLGEMFLLLVILNSSVSAYFYLKKEVSNLNNSYIN